jgi:hypothetical protein
MKLNKREMRLVLSALENAISDREGFIDAHYRHVKIMGGFNSLVLKTKRQIANYLKMRHKLFVALKEATDAK